MNAMPLPKMNVHTHRSSGKKPFSFGSLLESLFTQLSKDSQCLANAPSENHRSVSLGPLEHEFIVNGIYMHFPPEIQLEIFEHLSMTFEEAVKIASEKGGSIDWAYQYHDPSKDNYAIVKEWRKMDDPLKDQLKEKMMLNPTLRNLLRWKGELNPTHDNLMSAVVDGNLDVVRYLIIIGVEPHWNDLNYAIRQGNLEIVKFLIKEGKIHPDSWNLYR
jgi:hypothetical protein